MQTSIQKCTIQVVLCTWFCMRNRSWWINGSDMQNARKNRFSWLYCGKNNAWEALQYAGNSIIMDIGNSSWRCEMDSAGSGHVLTAGTCKGNQPSIKWQSFLEQTIPPAIEDDFAHCTFIFGLWILCYLFYNTVNNSHSFILEIPLCL